MKFKCKVFPKKATFFTQKRARRALMRIISHTTVNMFDLHTYECPNKVGNLVHWHVGHISYFETKLQKEKTHEQVRIQQTIPTTGN